MQVQSGDYTLRMPGADIGQLPPLVREAHLTEERLRLGERAASSNSGRFHSVLRPFAFPHSLTPTLLGAGRTAVSCSPRMPYGGASGASSKEENRGSPDQILKDWW